MKLPNSDQSFIADEKVENYLLNVYHNDGRSKAKFFLNRGFSLENIEIFKNALMLHSREREVTEKVCSEYGEKFTLKCEIETPDLKNPCIVSVWTINEGEKTPQACNGLPALKMKIIYL